MDQGVGRQVKTLREEKNWSMAKLAVEADMSVSGVSMIENGKRNLTTTTLAKLANALEVEVADLFPKVQAPLPDLEDERRAEATGRSEEERIEISSALASAIEQLEAGHRGALEELSGGAPGEIFALFMQATLSHIGATTIAEDAGYSIDTEGDSAAEREVKSKMRSALDKMERTVDEIERAMTASEAEQELPEGVASLARYQMRRAVWYFGNSA